MLLGRSGFALLEWSVRSKVREKDGPALRLVRRIKSRLLWGSTMQFIAKPCGVSEAPSPASSAS